MLFGYEGSRDRGRLRPDVLDLVQNDRDINRGHLVYDLERAGRQALYPPSIVTIEPVMKLEAGLAMNATRFAMSLVVP
jgi:hypothetical protein